MHLSPMRRRRYVGAAAVIGTVAGLLSIAPAAIGKPTPPPNPSNNQISAAQQQKDSLANQVGALGGQIAQAQTELQQLQGRKELAEQKVAYAISKLQIAQHAAVVARSKVRRAEQTVVAAHTKFVQYVQASYMDGSQSGATGTLLTATDPNTLLNENTLEQYQAENKIDAIGTMQRASVGKSNADAQARLAVLNTTKAANDAQQARQAADDAVAAQQAQKAQLETTLANSRASLDAAQSELATLNNQRAAYDAYVIEQRRLAAIARAKAARERAARIAAAQAAAAAAAAARRRQQNSGGGGSSGGGGGSTFVPVSGPSAPTGGSWTAAKGRAAVNRALSTVGTPYAWAGGGQYGPSTGVCDASQGAPNDCYVTGYDCSGLTMYAWGQGWAHYAATQFTEAGSYHPSAGNLRPGDLIFWSNDNTIGQIHHVAVYKGGGQIIEAPYSGGYVQVAPLYEYGSFFGATRPLT